LKIYFCKVTGVEDENYISADVIGKNISFKFVGPLGLGPLDRVEIHEEVVVISLDNENAMFDLSRKDNVNFYLKKNVAVPYLAENGLDFFNKGIAFDSEELYLYSGKYLDEDIGISLINTILIDEIPYQEEIIIDGKLFQQGFASRPTKLFITELEPNVDYKNNIIELLYYDDSESYKKEDDKENALVGSDKRLIVDFTYVTGAPELSFVEISSPLSQTAVEALVIEYEIHSVDINHINGTSFIDINAGNGFFFSMNSRKDERSGVILKSPSSDLEIHEDTIVQNEENEAFVRGDQFLRYRSANYSQIYSGGKATDEQVGIHSEMLDHEDRRGYEFSIFNQDYFDIGAEEQVHNQAVLLSTPKHLFELVDTIHTGEPGDLEGAREQEMLYSSLDGNYIKFMSNSSLGSALEMKTHLGHRTVWDDSHLTFEQHKTYNRDTKKLVTMDGDDGEEEKPVNFLDFDKTTEAEMVTLESHSNSEDKYDILMNKFVFSETAEESTATLTNSATEEDTNTINITATEGEGSIKIDNVGEEKSNNVTMTTSGDVEVKIENTFADGKTNTIHMTKELIKISNAEDKVVIEIDAENMKITTEADFNVESSGDVNVKGTNVKVEGDVEITGGSCTMKGTASPEGSGPFLSVPNCLFTGAPISSTKVSGN